MERRTCTNAAAVTTATEGYGSSGALQNLASLAERRLRERLVGELEGGSDVSKLRAAARLVELVGDEAVPAILGALEGGSAPLRSSLVEILGKAGCFYALDAVIALQGDADVAVRAAAVEAAARLCADDPDAAEAVLRAGLRDPEPRVRRRAALCAATARGLDPGGLLVPLLADEDPQARRLAAVALGSTRRPEAAAALIGALQDEEESVRAAAGGSLELLLEVEALSIAAMPELQRGRAVARLRAHLAANLSRLAPDGELRLPMDLAPSLALAWTSRPYDRGALAEAVASEPAAEAVTAEAVAAEAVTAEAVAAEAVAAEAVVAEAVVAAQSEETLDDWEGALELEEVEVAEQREEPKGPFFFREIEQILRAALRGVEDSDLAEELGFSPLAFGPVLEEHLEAGRIVRRGKKLYLP